MSWQPTVPRYASPKACFDRSVLKLPVEIRLIKRLSLRSVHGIKVYTWIYCHRYDALVTIPSRKLRREQGISLTNFVGSYTLNADGPSTHPFTLRVQIGWMHLPSDWPVFERVVIGNRYVVDHRCEVDDPAGGGI
jgi:hypothetical protein